MSSSGITGSRLHHLVEQFKGKKVAALGDMVCDEFVYGDIARVSREAPVLILDHNRSEIVPGGGGNAVANLRALGADPLPVGVVGRDEPGERLLEVFAGRGIEISGMRAEPGYRTPTKSRIIAGGVHTRRQQVVRVDRGSPHGILPAKAVERLAGRLARSVSRADGLLVADYGYGAAVPEMIVPARLPVVADSRVRISKYRNVTAATPNQEELENAVGIKGFISDKEFEAAGGRLLRRTGNRALLVTRGSRGMCLFTGRGKMQVIPAYGTDEVADVTGAGDTVIATFTLACICGGTFLEAAVLANYAAGLVVMKAGTAIVTPEELHGAITEDTVA